MSADPRPTKEVRERMVERLRQGGVVNESQAIRIADDSIRRVETRKENGTFNRNPGE